MKWFLPLLLGFLPVQHISDLELPTLNIQATRFQEAFNSASDRSRLVAVFSPT